MFIRHFAWLHSRPGKSKVTRYKQLSSETVPSPLLELPKIDYAEYLLDFLFEIGLSKSGSAGLSSLTWAEVYYWQQANNFDLSYWERKSIIELSRIFVTAFNEFEGEIVPAPYQPEDIDQSVISQRVGGLLRSIANRKSKRKRR